MARTKVSFGTVPATRFKHSRIVLVAALAALAFLFSQETFGWTEIPAMATFLPCETDVVYRGPAGIPALRTRADLGALMQARGFTHGAEVGVQSGSHAKQILQA
jgi:hypothetical protein